MKEGYRNIRRVQKIVSVLIKYGFGGLVSQMKVLSFTTKLASLITFRRAGRGMSVPVRIRLVLEELGPTFIKLGQVASTRADILPPDWIVEFKKLRDMVPPTPSDQIKKVVERSLKGSLTEKFKCFAPEPVAAASIAQVHLAELHDGTEVAVKIKRPKIDAIIEGDISVMYSIAWLFERYVPASHRYRPREVVDEFSRIIHKELDMSIEASNINIFEKLFKDDKRIQIPRVYWDHTTNEVLTMERIHGTPMDESEKILSKGLDIHEIAVNGIDIFFRQVFEYGVFHADLHPGNIFVRDDGVIIYLDFGIVGRIDPSLRRYLANLLYCLMREDYHRMAVIHKDMGLIGKDVDIAEFEDALRDIAEPIIGKPLEKIAMSAILMKLFETARRFQMKLQPNLLLLQKSMVIIEGVGRQLYPDIDMWEVMKPLITKWMIKEKLSPKSVYNRGKDNTLDMIDTLLALPHQASTFLDKANSGSLDIGVTHHGLDLIADEIENSGKRRSWSVVIASLVIGGFAITALSPEGSAKLLGIPTLGWVGFALAFLMTLRVVLIRDRKRD